jgi:uncharacterized protein (DUF885 family)
MTTLAVAPSPVNELADRFWDWFLETQPLWATILGDERWNDRWDDPSPAGREQEMAGIHRLLAEADTVDTPDLDTNDRITLDMLRVVAKLRLAHHQHRVWQMEAVDQLAGPQNLPGELARFQRIDTPERLQQLLARLAAYPDYMAKHVANIQGGVREGRTAAKPVIERTITQVRRAVETPTGQHPLLVVHADADPGVRAALEQAIEHDVRPAMAAFLTAIEEYAQHAREGEGICWLPDGADLYRYAILASTTLEEDAQSLHDYGLSLLDVIDAERAEIARDLGFEDVAAFRAHLDGDPSNFAAQPGDLVELATRQVEKATALAPQYFGRLPRAACEVRAVEPHQEQEAPSAFYFPPAVDGSRPGIYFINTFDPSQRPLHRLATTTYHEAVPGHHFQIALEAEMEDMPAFRRLGSRLTGAAYPEGWGLYSERLADEMGLFDNPRERFGMLDAQAWRAARLVVDTGLHAFRWGRQQSIDFLIHRAGLSTLEAETETDRYIAWPGQALAYMTGQREIQALRRQLEARDGARFDLQGFHDAVLGHGSLPLATLSRYLPEWVAPKPD